MIFFISAMVLLFSMIKSLQIGRCALGKQRMIINSGIGRAVRSGSVPCNMNTARWSSGSSADISNLRKPDNILAGLRPNSQKYFDYHHTEIDTFENVNKRELELGSAAVASLVYLFDKYGIRN